MRYLMLVGDGMADDTGERPTPLEAARTPNMDLLAGEGFLGLVRTIPPGAMAGSDVANLALFGNDPLLYPCGRAPLEAAGMGVSLSGEETACRCSLVTLAGEARFADARLVSPSAGEIAGEDASALLEALGAGLFWGRLYPGGGYRNLMVFDGPVQGCPPPQEALGKRIGPFLTGSPQVCALMQTAWALLRDHPVNRDRRERGLLPASGCWLWGAGRTPALPDFFSRYRLSGSVVAGVDIIRGLGALQGLRVIRVPGADGSPHTNYGGKARAALAEFRQGREFVFLHVEAPDECSHSRDRRGKIAAIERIDREVLGPVLRGLWEDREPFAAAVLPDHPTHWKTGLHSPDPVPFALYRSGQNTGLNVPFTEREAAKTGLFLPEGRQLTEGLLRGLPPGEGLL